ncbi:MAG: DUF3857 domain-containing protein [Candidatus Omnitrophota bacterium]
MLLKSSRKILFLVFVLSLAGYFYGRQSSLEDFSQRYEKISSRQQQLLKDKPGDLKLKARLAGFYYNFRDYEKVVELLEGIDSLEVQVIKAKALAKSKEYSKAITIFEQLKFKPKDCEYLYLYGQTLEQKNLFPKAVEVYKKVCGRFKLLAQQRLKAIKAKTEYGVPLEVIKLSQEAESFIEEVQDEGAIYLLVNEDIEITSQNTSISTVHVIEKVLQERGKELAEIVIGYDSTYERVELEFARVITKDKRIIYAAKENIRDVSRYLNFPLYSNSRAFIISMPAVDLGSFIEYKIKIHSSKLIAEDNFNFTYRLKEKYPIFKSKFNLIVPEKKQVNFSFFNQQYAKGVNLEPLLAKKGDKKIYSLNFRKIKPIIPEYSMPADSLVNPAVLISSFSSWKNIYTWWHSLYEDKITVNEEIREFIKGLIEGASNSREQAKKIYEYVAKNIRYVAVEYGDSGHEPHCAKEVFVNRYGDCKDQAILLTAMLRSVGLKAYPVLIPTRSAYPINEDFPSINFNHAICVLNIDQEFIFMDPTSETTSFGRVPLADQGRLVMVFLEDNFKLITTPDIKENEIKYDMNIVLDAEENALITRKIESSGFFASGYRGYLKYTHPEVIKESIQEKMTEISSSSQLLSYKIENAEDFDKDPILIYEFNAQNFLNPAGKLRIMPAFDQLYLDYSLISKDDREFSIDFEGLYTKLAKIKVTLPKNLKIQYLPSSKVFDNAWFKLEVDYENNNGCIDFNQKFTPKKRFVPKEEYQEFKKYLGRALYFLKEEVILQVK